MPLKVSSAVRAPVVLGVLATVLSLVGSWRVSFWTDEAATLSAADRSLPQLDDLTRSVDAVHGVYGAMMHAWISVAGASPFAVRLPSAVAVGVATAGVYVLGRQLLGSRGALVAAVAFMLLPRVTGMGIEARSFAMTLAAAVWATVVVVAMCRSRQHRLVWLAVAYAAVVGFGTALNLYVVLLLAAHGVSLLVVRPRRAVWGAWVAASAAAVVLAAPAVLRSVAQSGQLGVPQLGPVTLARNVLVNQWFLGITPADGSSGEMLWTVGAVAAAGLAWGLVGWAALHLLRRSGQGESRDEPGAWRRQPGVRAAWCWSVPFFVVPTLLVVAYAVVAAPEAYNARYLTFCAPGLALTLGAAATLLRRRQALALGLVFVVAVTPVVVSQRTVTAKGGADWVLAADRVSTLAEPGDVVYFAPQRGENDDGQHKTRRELAIAYPRAFAGLTDLTLRQTPAESGTLWGVSDTLEEAEPRLAGVDRLWVLYSNKTETTGQDRERLAGLGFSPTVEESWGQTTVLLLER